MDRWNQSILIDCGEGMCAQIHRRYGDSTVNVIERIKAVFVSHLHYDHHGGLVELLRMRQKYLPPNRPPLLVLCPKADLKSWLFFYDKAIEAIHDDLYFVDNDSFVSIHIHTLNIFLKEEQRNADRFFLCLLDEIWIVK